MRWGMRGLKDEELFEEQSSSMKSKDTSSMKSKRQEDFVSPRTSLAPNTSGALTWFVLEKTSRYSYSARLTPLQLNALIQTLPDDTVVTISESKQLRGTIDGALSHTHSIKTERSPGRTTEHENK